jgi:hypothetical protein
MKRVTLHTLLIAICISTTFLGWSALAAEVNFCTPSLSCVQCPIGALCRDKSCALSNSPLWTCNGTQDILLGDLNEWDGAKWINVPLTFHNKAPLPRQNAGYASSDNLLYLYGGIGGTGGNHKHFPLFLFSQRSGPFVDLLALILLSSS